MRILITFTYRMNRHSGILYIIYIIKEIPQNIPFKNLIWIHNKLKLPIKPYRIASIWDHSMQQKLWNLWKR